MRPSFLRFLLLGLALAALVGTSSCGLDLLARDIVRDYQAKHPEIQTNFGNPPIRAELSGEQIATKITQAAEEQLWSIVQTDASTMVATKEVGNYMAAVTIQTRPGGYSIRYKDSKNMDYSGDGRTGRILDLYNHWVERLNNAILQALRE